MPPRERITQSGLSISRDTHPISPEQREKSRLEQDSSTLRVILSKKNIEVEESLMREDAIPANMKEVPYISSVEKHTVAQTIYRQSKNPKEKLEALKALNSRLGFVPAMEFKTSDTYRLTAFKAYASKNPQASLYPLNIYWPSQLV